MAHILANKTAINEPTIVAQATPTGSGAIALIRISGSYAIAYAAQCVQLKKGVSLSQVASHTIHYGSIIDNAQNIIDHVLIIVMKAPHTFTGEDTVEISCHNNPFIIQNVIQALIAAGARSAQPGEFTRRALLNNKLDVVQAEAIVDLIGANNQEALKLALQQLEGSLSAKIAGIEQQLFTALAYCNASFEFIEEENITFDNQITELIQQVHAQINEILASRSHQKQLREGIRIALIGSVNVGKSSLFNALLKQSRAIVTDIPGTTRDTIEAGIYTNNRYLTLIDTAGLRDTTDSIEQQGIIRSEKEAQSADIILLIYDQHRSLEPNELKSYQHILNVYRNKTIVVANKSDLPAVAHHPLQSEHTISASCTNTQSIDTLRNVIEEKIAKLYTSGASTFLLNQRQLQLLESAYQELTTALPLLHEPLPYELIAAHIEETLKILQELTGKTISDKVIDQIFRSFCVGK